MPIRLSSDSRAVSFHRATVKVVAPDVELGRRPQQSHACPSVPITRSSLKVKPSPTWYAMSRPVGHFGGGQPPEGCAVAVEIGRARTAATVATAILMPRHY